MRKALGALSDEIMIIVNESKKDDQKDDDGDGVADVKQIGKREYVKRKVKLVLTKVNPQKVNDAIASMYVGKYIYCATFTMLSYFAGGITAHTALQLQNNDTYGSVDERLGCSQDSIC